MNKRQILVIDDDPQIRKLLEINLQANDYVVTTAENGKNGILNAANHPPDLIILDLGLPDMSGLAVLKALREWYLNPILILSAVDDEETVVNALDFGANDYLTKPFRAQELLARLRSSLRYSGNTQLENMISVGELRIDLVAHVFYKDNEELKLTATEYKLISLLMRFSGKVLTYRFILKEIWGPGYQMETQYLRVYIAQLRKKIEADPNQPQHLKTESRIGYRLV